MAGFRDICLQVRYDGTLPELSRDFFGTVAPVAVRHQVRVWSLTRESLLPVSLHLAECRRLGKPLRLLVSLAKPEPAPDAVGVLDADGDQNVVGECTEALKWAPPAEGGDEAPAGGDCELSVSVAVVTLPDNAIPSPTRCVGQMVDELGNGIEYVADWGEAVGEKRQITVAWSWGDPSFRVTKGINGTDAVWDGRAPNAKAVATNADWVLSFQEVLTELIRCPGLTTEPKRGRELFKHQREAVDRWMAQDCRGIFKMCTGAGKTIAALAGARMLGEKQVAAGLVRPPVVITVPTRVLADQWIEEIKRFGFPVALAAYNSFDQWNDYLDGYLRIKHDDGPRFIVTTYCSFVDDRFTVRLKRAADEGKEALWIADEMHNLSSHRLREAMKAGAGLFRYRLGLSATPDIEGDFSATEFLKGYFGDICKTYELRDGIGDRVLCRYRYYPVPAFLDPALGGQYLSLLSQIHGPGVDPAKLVNLYRLTRQLLRTSGVQLSRFADLLRQLVIAEPALAHTLVYCPPGYGTYGSDNSDEIDHDADELRLVEGVVAIIREKGLSTSSILGETPGVQRKEILKRFGKGSLQTLCQRFQIIVSSS